MRPLSRLLQAFCFKLFKILGLFSCSSKMLVLGRANNDRKPRGLFEGNGSLENTFTSVMISECSVCVDTH